MTTEIAIMNRHAVALAADSAVTVRYGGGQQKIFPSASKVFSLSYDVPVGIMIYSQASFMGVPWETIIKQYREQIGDTCCATVEEYAKEFINYLSETKDQFFPSQQQKKHTSIRISALYEDIKTEIICGIRTYIDENGSISEQKLKRLVTDVVGARWETVESAPLLHDVDPSDVRSFRLTYHDLIEEKITSVFEELPISQRSYNRLKKIAAEGLMKAGVLNYNSGIVVAGFGEKDLFPSLVELRMYLLANEKLFYEITEPRGVEFENTACIVPFAQKDVIHTFMEGIDPELKGFIDKYIQRLLSDYPKMILDSIDAIDEQDKQDLIDRLEKQTDKLVQNYQEGAQAYRRESHIGPVINVVANLPKEQLAELAEALVNLTSIKRRFTTDRETVGGPIDVAVISKGDGLVWIDRKHYFEAEKNVHFLAKYYQG
ncbi:MAG: hypothetical protein ACLFWL_17675 [Candidatus Brocadiia bacterium]